MKFISHVEQDISLVRFAHSEDIPLVNATTKINFIIFAHPCIFSKYNR